MQGATMEEGGARYAASDAPSKRQTASALSLLRAAVGGPRQVPRKAWRFARTLLRFLDARDVDRRLARLQSRGLIETVPSRLQLAVGGYDMLRYFIVPGARDYYESRGIDFSFHQLLRFLDDPVSVIDPVGILSARDTIIGHVLQVVHANPIYDLQLLEMFEDGLDEMERQTEAVAEGTHPRARSLGAIVEDPDYHRRLLDYIRRYRRDPRTPPLLRKDGHAREDPSFVLAEWTFGELPSFMRYALRLPTRPREVLAHLARDRVISARHCDPEVVEAHRRAYG
jgi:hypothetical protein